MEAMKEAVVKYEICNQTLILYIEAELDHHTVQGLREFTDHMIELGNIKNVIFDFYQVDFMDSSGIGLLIGRYKQVKCFGGKIAVTNVEGNVDRIFRMSGVYQIMDKYDTPASVMEAWAN